MKQENFRTLIFAVMVALYFAIVGCAFGLVGVGMPAKYMVFAILGAGGVAYLVGSRIATELFKKD